MAGHATGPKSLNYRKAVMTTDNLILWATEIFPVWSDLTKLIFRSLQKSLKQKELESEVNLIVLSAHGIMNLRKPTLIVDITKFAPFARSAATFPLGGPYLTLYPHKGTLPKVLS